MAVMAVSFTAGPYPKEEIFALTRTSVIGPSSSISRVLIEHFVYMRRYAFPLALIRRDQRTDDFMQMLRSRLEGTFFQEVFGM